MSGETASNASKEMTLKELRLRPGMLLQLQSDNRAADLEGHFLTALTGKGVMIATHDAAEEPRIGAEYRIRGFTGQYDFGFTSRVLQSFKSPVAYAVFTYPDKATARLVRHAMRMKTLIPATAWAGNDDKPVPTRIVDLSIAGAMLSSPTGMGTTGDPMRISFPVICDGFRTTVNVAAKIAHSGELDGSVRIGVMFGEIEPTARMALQCYLKSLQELESGVCDC